MRRFSFDNTETKVVAGEDELATLYFNSRYKSEVRLREFRNGEYSTKEYTLRPRRDNPRQVELVGVASGVKSE